MGPKNRDLDVKSVTMPDVTELLQAWSHGEPGALERMSAAAKELSRPGAAARSAEILEQVARDFN